MFWYTGISSNASRYFGRTVKMVWGCGGVLTVLRQHFSMRAPCRSEVEPAALLWGLRGPLCFPCALAAGVPVLDRSSGGSDHCRAHSASPLPVSAGGAPEWRQLPLLFSSGALEPPCPWCLGTHYFLYVVHFSWWLEGDLVCAHPPEAGHIRHFTERHSEATWLFFILIVFSLIFDL